MADVVDLRPFLALRPQIAEMTTIVLADAISDAFAEYCEEPDDIAFTDVLTEIAADLVQEITDPEELQERYWHAVARRCAIMNGIEIIDQAFCKSFDPHRHHVPALQWARKFMDSLPARYLRFLEARQ